MSCRKRRADGSKSPLDVADEQRRFDPNDAIARAHERCIAARISAPTLTVIRAIDLNHETLRGSQEVSDEAPKQRRLPPKDHAQATAAKVVP